MSIRFQCECGKKLKATDDKIGKRVLCPDCGQPVTVPAKDRMRAELIEPSADPERPVKDSAKSAKELLKLSAAASRGEQETEKPTQASGRQRGEEVTLTFGEWVSQNGKVIGLPAAGVVVACVLLYFVSSWMWGSKLVYPELLHVTGTILLNDKPLADAHVTFRPQVSPMSESKIPMGASYAQTDSEGHFSLNYDPNVSGAVAGKHIVEVSKVGPDGIETLPAKYLSGQSTYEIEVSADKADGYEIKLEL